MRYLFNFCIFLSVSVCFLGCSSGSLKKEMIAFDRVFIPAYFYSYVGQTENARKAMSPLIHQWREMDGKYANLKAGSEDWRESFRLTGGWLEEAIQALDEEDPSSALCQLDHARYELIDLRWRYKIDYYLDAYWDLEGIIAVVVETSEDQMLGLMDWKEFMELSRDMRKEWERLKNNPLVPEAHELSEEKALSLVERQVAFEETLLYFEQAVASADLCEVRERGKEVEIAYFNCLLLFGDFGASEVYYANN